MPYIVYTNVLVQIQLDKPRNALIRLHFHQKSGPQIISGLILKRINKRVVLKRLLEELDVSRLKPVSPFAALLLRRKSERVVVIGDLHIGWEVNLARQGIHVPSQTSKLLEKAVQVIEVCKPTRLIFLGDVKHTVARVEMEEWHDVPEFFEKISKLVQDIEVVPGNHDGNLEPLTTSNVKILPSTGTVLLGSVGIFHGHAWPSPELLACESLIMGHLHPVVMFKDVLGFRIMRQVWVKAKCDGERLAKALLKHLNVKVEGTVADEVKRHFNVGLKNPDCVIMPSFNDFLGGQAVNRRIVGGLRESRAEYIGPVLRSGSIDLDNAEAYLLDGTFLGKIEQLRSFT
jgi:hypothetical protein